MPSDPEIGRVETAVYRIPTDFPEADGTYAWDATTLVVVHVEAGGARGLGWTYAGGAAARAIREHLAPKLAGRSALAVEAAWNAMVAEVRNVGRPGLVSTAISAVDAALWDLKARLLGVALVDLLGAARAAAPVYGSGGFTSYDERRLCAQLAGWVEQGIARVKMKVGTRPEADAGRVAAVRRAVGERPELMVDANGAYARKQALAQAEAFARQGVVWLEEPVSSDDLAGLRLLRDRGPAGMAIAAGEYGWDLMYFRRMLEAGAVDVLQADATRCLGITGFLGAARLCQAFGVPLSAHCAPTLHMHAACAATPLVHIEWFHDHVRIERLLLDGFVEPQGGALRPDRSRPGLGVALKRADAARYAVQEAS